MMAFLSRFLAVALVSAFLENIVLTRAIGTSTVLAAARGKGGLLSFGTIMTVITTLASAGAFGLDRLLGSEPSFYIYMPLLYVMLIGLIYILLLLVLWKFAPGTFGSIKRYVHVSSFNCAVLSGMFLSGTQGGGIAEYLGYGFGTGVGFMLALALVAEGSRRMEADEVPAAFRGYPLQLLYIGILSMAFFAFSGHAPAI